MSIPKHEIICGIYKITSPTGRIYIGQSIDIYETWRVRYRNKRKAQAQRKLFASLNKYGHYNHVFEIIHSCERNNLDEMEMYYISHYNTFNTDHGMNLTKGGGGNKGHSPSEESRRKIGLAHKGNKRLLGYKQTDEHRNNIRKGNKGKKRLPEFSERLRIANTGKKHSEETKQKIRKIVNEPAYRQRMLSYKLGVKRPIEVVEKIRKKNSKVIFNTVTGEYYLGLRSAALALGISPDYLGAQICGIYKNYSSCIYVEKTEDVLSKIKTSKASNGMDLTIGRKGNRVKRTEETKEKLRIANTGRKMLPEQIEKMRLTKIGKKASPETRQKMRDAANDPINKQRNRERNSGENHPKSFLGRHHTSETKEKIAEKLNKLILNTKTGIFYFGAKEAAESVPMNHKTLVGKLCGIFKNNTSFIYV